MAKRFEFLDRPVFVTLLGGVLISVITLLWQTSEQRHTLELQYQRARLDQKFQLLRTFPSVFEMSGNTVNSRMVHVLWQAEEKNRPKHQQNKDHLKEWRAELRRLEQEHPKIEPLDGILAQVAVIFGSHAVIAKVDQFRRSWADFEKLLYAINRQYNVAESLSDKEVKDFHAQRMALINVLNALKDDLIREMGREVSSPSGRVRR